MCPLIQHIEKKHIILKYSLPNLTHRPGPERCSMQTESASRWNSGIISIWNVCSLPFSGLCPAHGHVWRASQTLFWDICIQLPLILTFSQTSGGKSPPNIHELICVFKAQSRKMTRQSNPVGGQLRRGQSFLFLVFISKLFKFCLM